MSDGYPDIGPGGCGTWSSFDVPAIWSMLAYEDGVLSVEQATAWNRTYDLLASHAKNLQTLRDSLVERWPPEHNEASAVFLEYLDKLIGSVNPASYASSSNAVVLSDLVDTLAEAKGKVAPLHEQWEAAAASGTADPKLQGELNARAAEIMSSTDVAVYQHGQRFVVPPEYEPPTGTVEPMRPFSPPAAVAPPTRTTPGTVPSVGQSPANRSLPLKRGNESGPALSRSLTPPGPHVATTDAAQRRGTFTETPSGRALAPGGVIGLPGVSPLPRTDDEASIGKRSSRTQGQTSTRRGNVPGTGNEPEKTPARSLSTWRPTEVGRGVGERSASSGGPGGLGVYGGQGRTSRDRGPQGGEHYQEWFIQGGVSPVLMSSPEPETHDPGPGVIGIDR